MKKLFFIFIYSIFIIHPSFSQAPVVKQWDARFGGTKSDYFSSFSQTTDGGFILGGTSWSDSSGEKTQHNWGPGLTYSDYWIVKIDSIGIKQWDKRFGGTQSDALTSIHQTRDGGYILGGFSNSDSSGDKTQPNWDTLSGSNNDYWVVKTDSLGNKLWDKRFGGTGGETLSSIEQTIDGGYILGGSSYSDSSGDKTQNNWSGLGVNDDYWIVKIDSMGNKEWDKRYGGTWMDWLYSILQTTDKGYILGGHSKSDISGDKTQDNWDPTGNTFDYWIVKIDSLGNKQWDRRLGGTRDDRMFSLKQVRDGGYVMVGYSSSDSTGDKTQACWDTALTNRADYWVVKIDSQGNRQWDKRLGGLSDDVGYSMAEVSDGGYLFAGISESPANGDKTENNLGPGQEWVVKTDSLGNKIWDKTIFTSYYEHLVDIFIQDGCFTLGTGSFSRIGGYKTQDNWDTATINPTVDYWIVKFCDTIFITTGIIPALNKPVEGINIFPNPTRDELTVNCFSLTGNPLLRVLNILGEEIFSSYISSSGFKLPTSHLQPGIYFLEVRTEQKKFFAKFVKE